MEQHTDATFLSFVVVIVLALQMKDNGVIDMFASARVYFCNEKNIKFIGSTCEIRG
jgi:hypothetical protein